MAGIFHAFFGCAFGLLIWKLSEGKNGEKRFSLPLIFIFAINNYIGPDLGGIFADMGADGSLMWLLGNAIHSYAGFLIFAIPYAVCWYLVLLGIDRPRTRNLAKAGITGGEGIIHASYPKVLLMVIAGGLMHQFVDSVSHPYKYQVGDWYYPQGRFVLIPQMPPEFWLLYGIIIASIAGLVALYLASGIRHRHFTLADKIHAAFTRETARAAGIAGLVLLNALMLYGILQAGGLLRIDERGITFMLGNLLHIAATIFESSAIWWIAVTTAPTLVMFFLCYVKTWRLRIKRTTIRADLFVVLCYIAALLVGYALQPVIGNVSGSEADTGALLYTWSTIGTALVAIILARSHNVPERLPAATP